MVAPVVLGSLAFVVLPLVMVVWYSLHEWNVLANTFTFVGAENYQRMVADPGLADALRATVWFSIGLVVVNIALALLLAVLLNQRLPGTTTFRTFFFSPVVVSLVAWTIVWSFLLQADGGINGFLSLLGRSEERRVGKECRLRWARDREKKERGVYRTCLACRQRDSTRV